jgi:hypothetical protein
MSYLKTIQVCDGSGEPGRYRPYVIFKCDVTGEEIEEAWPHFYIKNDFGQGVHISHNGFYKLMEDFLLNGFHAGIMPYVMAELVDRYHKRRKFNRYIRPELKEKILAKYEHTCVKCGKHDNLTIDHIIPVVKGGKNDYTNLQVLCMTCNRKKGKKENKQFMENPLL